MLNNTDKLIRTVDTNPANGPGNVYQRLPERAAWSVFKTYERPDGTRYTETWECSRWGGTFAAPFLKSAVECEPLIPVTRAVPREFDRSEEITRASVAAVAYPNCRKDGLCPACR